MEEFFFREIIEIYLQELSISFPHSHKLHSIGPFKKRQSQKIPNVPMPSTTTLLPDCRIKQSVRIIRGGEGGGGDKFDDNACAITSRRNDPMLSSAAWSVEFPAPVPKFKGGCSCPYMGTVNNSNKLRHIGAACCVVDNVVTRLHSHKNNKTWYVLLCVVYSRKKLVRKSFQKSSESQSSELDFVALCLGFGEVLHAQL